MQSLLHVSVLLLCSQAVAGKEEERLVRSHSNNRVAMSVSSTGKLEEELEELKETTQLRPAVQGMLTELENMARAGVTPEPDKISTIKGMVENPLMTDLMYSHQTTTQQINDGHAAIGTCNSNAASSMEGIKSGTEVTVSSERTEHTSCRGTEEKKTETKKEKCQNLDTFLDGINVPSDLPAARGRAQMVQYVKTSTDYWCPKGPECKTLDGACTTATTVQETQKAKCDKAQATFELGYCTWRTELVDTCNAQTQCYDLAVKAYNDQVAETKELVKKWKVEFAALKKILCYCEVWLNDNNVNTADANQLAKCNDYIDTSPMDIAYPAVPDKAECSLTAVEQYPGSAGFSAQEYSAFSQFAAEPIPCLAPPTTR